MKKRRLDKKKSILFGGIGAELPLNQMESELHEWMDLLMMQQDAQSITPVEYWMSYGNVIRSSFFNSIPRMFHNDSLTDTQKLYAIMAVWSKCADEVIRAETKQKLGAPIPNREE